MNVVVIYSTARSARQRKIDSHCLLVTEPQNNSGFEGERISLSLQLASAGFLLGLFFNPEDRDDMFFRNLSCL
jgi:hypothetical protein